MEEWNEKVERIDEAIKKLLSSTTDDDHLLLSKLLSQLESLRGQLLDQTPASDDPQHEQQHLQQQQQQHIQQQQQLVGTMIPNSPPPAVDDASQLSPPPPPDLLLPAVVDHDDADPILKELRNVRRQNLVTHCLLSVMIVLTLAWQLSEVSLLLKLKDGFTHPFRSFGAFFSGMFKRPVDDALNNDSDVNNKQQPPISPLIDLGLNGKDGSPDD